MCSIQRHVFVSLKGHKVAQRAWTMHARVYIFSSTKELYTDSMYFWTKILIWFAQIKHCTFFYEELGSRSLLASMRKMDDDQSAAKMGGESCPTGRANFVSLKISGNATPGYRGLPICVHNSTNRGRAILLIKTRNKIKRDKKTKHHMWEHCILFISLHCTNTNYGFP